MTTLELNSIVRGQRVPTPRVGGQPQPRNHAARRISFASPVRLTINSNGVMIAWMKASGAVEVMPGAINSGARFFAAARLMALAAESVARV